MVSFFPYRHCAGNKSTSNRDGLALLKTRFCKQQAMPFVTGGAALDWLLGFFGLNRWDEIWVTTTFDFPNVSSCVTSTVFNHCKPSRVLTTATRAIIVIHEFGVPHKVIKQLRLLADQKNIPLIEDCAHTIDSYDDGILAGTICDWTLLSLPKVFPMPEGGILLGESINYTPDDYELNRLAEIQSGVNQFIFQVAEDSNRRREVFRQLTAIADEFDLSALFKVTENISPWFFPLKTKRWCAYLDVARSMEIDIAKWHGCDIVVLPCHQYLKDAEFDQIRNLMVQVEDKNF